MAEENNTDKTRQEFQSIAEETAAIFGNTLRSIASNIAKELKDNTDTLDDLGKSLLRNFKNDLNSLARSASNVLDIQKGLLDGSIKQKDILKARESLDLKLNKLQQARNELIQENGRLSKKQEEDYKRAVAIAEEQKNVLIKQEEIFVRINKQLGFAGNIFKVIGKTLKTIGLEDPFENIISKTAAARTQLQLNNEELEGLNSKGKKLTKVEQERKDELEKQNTDLKNQSSLGEQIKKGFNEILNTQNLIAVASAAVLKQVFEINKAQTDLRRNLGESANTLGLIDNKFGTIADQINTINSLTEQFGFNTLAAFDAINLREATELTKALGLSAEEAGMLAFNAQVSGEYLDEGFKNSIKGISPLLSQRKILQEVAKISPSISLAFGNSNEELAKAASNAKLLGLNLSQVDKIANGLLDIEASLAAEYEAEVITGRQLNLNRARDLALVNDINGLTKEIANNQAILNVFAGNQRLQQEAIAKALFLSRDELAQMIREQQVLGQMSEKEIQEKEAADFKRLEIQQSLNDSIAKMAEVLAGPVELAADLLLTFKNIIPAVLAITAGIKAANAAEAIYQGFQIAKLRLKDRELSKEAALASVKAISNPVLAVIGLAAAAIVGGAAIAYMNKADDLVSPGMSNSGYGKRTLTGPEGTIALNNKDTVIAGTNLFPENTSPRNLSQNVVVTLSEQDIRAIANAVREGAQEGTSKANVQAVISRGTISQLSTRIQPELAVNTYKSAY